MVHLSSAVLIATKENDIPLPSNDNKVSMATERSSLLAGVLAGTLPSFQLRTENAYARMHGIWPSAFGQKPPECWELVFVLLNVHPPSTEQNLTLFILQPLANPSANTFRMNHW